MVKMAPKCRNKSDLKYRSSGCGGTPVRIVIRRSLPLREGGGRFSRGLPGIFSMSFAKISDEKI